MDFTLFHLANSRSQRIIWLLEELFLDYQLVICDTQKNGEISDKIKHVHNLGKVPILVIDDDQKSDPIILTESSAITDLFAYRYPDLGIKNLNSTEQVHYFYWKNFSEATLMPNLVLKQIFSQIIKRTPLPVRFITTFLKYGFDHGYLNPTLEQYMQNINAHLEQQQWMAGSKFTIADILIWFPIYACYQANPDFSKYSHIQSYLDQIQNRPAFQTALEKGQWTDLDFKNYWQKSW
nr:glutathione S-transferase [Acinetobacter sp. Marseille-Q1620]